MVTSIPKTEPRYKGVLGDRNTDVQKIQDEKSDVRMIRSSIIGTENKNQEAQVMEDEEDMREAERFGFSTKKSPFKKACDIAPVVKCNKVRDSPREMFSHVAPASGLCETGPNETISNTRETKQKNRSRSRSKSQESMPTGAHQLPKDHEMNINELDTRKSTVKSPRSQDDESKVQRSLISPGQKQTQHVVDSESLQRGLNVTHSQNNQENKEMSLDRSPSYHKHRHLSERDQIFEGEPQYIRSKPVMGPPAESQVTYSKGQHPRKRVSKSPDTYVKGQGKIVKERSSKSPQAYSKSPGAHSRSPRAHSKSPRSHSRGQPVRERMSVSPVVHSRNRPFREQLSKSPITHSRSQPAREQISKSPVMSTDRAMSFQEDDDSSLSDEYPQYEREKVRKSQLFVPHRRISGERVRDKRSESKNVHQTSEKAFIKTGRNRHLFSSDKEHSLTESGASSGAEDLINDYEDSDGSLSEEYPENVTTERSRSQCQKSPVRGQSSKVSGAGCDNEASVQNRKPNSNCLSVNNTNYSDRNVRIIENCEEITRTVVERHSEMVDSVENKSVKPQAKRSSVSPIQKYNSLTCRNQGTKIDKNESQHEKGGETLDIQKQVPERPEKFQLRDEIMSKSHLPGQKCSEVPIISPKLAQNLPETKLKRRVKLKSASKSRRSSAEAKRNRKSPIMSHNSEQNLSCSETEFESRPVEINPGVCQTNISKEVKDMNITRSVERNSDLTPDVNEGLRKVIPSHTRSAESRLPTFKQPWVSSSSKHSEVSQIKYPDVSKPEKKRRLKTTAYSYPSIVDTCDLDKSGYVDYKNMPLGSFVTAKPENAMGKKISKTRPLDLCEKDDVYREENYKESKGMDTKDSKFEQHLEDFHDSCKSGVADRIRKVEPVINKSGLHRQIPTEEENETNSDNNMASGDSDNSDYIHSCATVDYRDYSKDKRKKVFPKCSITTDIKEKCYEYRTRKEKPNDCEINKMSRDFVHYSSTEQPNLKTNCNTFEKKIVSTERCVDKEKKEMPETKSRKKSGHLKKTGETNKTRESSSESTKQMVKDKNFFNSEEISDERTCSQNRKTSSVKDSHGSQHSLLSSNNVKRSKMLRNKNESEINKVFSVEDGKTDKDIMTLNSAEENTDRKYQTKLKDKKRTKKNKVIIPADEYECILYNFVKTSTPRDSKSLMLSPQDSVCLVDVDCENNYPKSTNKSSKSTNNSPKSTIKSPKSTNIDFSQQKNVLVHSERKRKNVRTKSENNCGASTTVSTCEFVSDMARTQHLRKPSLSPKYEQIQEELNDSLDNIHMVRTSESKLKKGESKCETEKQMENIESKIEKNDDNLIAKNRPRRNKPDVNYSELHVYPLFQTSSEEEQVKKVKINKKETVSVNDEVKTPDVYVGGDSLGVVKYKDDVDSDGSDYVDYTKISRNSKSSKKNNTKHKKQHAKKLFTDQISEVQPTEEHCKVKVRGKIKTALSRKVELFPVTPKEEDKMKVYDFKGESFLGGSSDESGIVPIDKGEDRNVNNNSDRSRGESKSGSQKKNINAVDDSDKTKKMPKMSNNTSSNKHKLYQTDNKTCNGRSLKDESSYKVKSNRQAVGGETLKRKRTVCESSKKRKHSGSHRHVETVDDEDVEVKKMIKSSSSSSQPMKKSRHSYPGDQYEEATRAPYKQDMYKVI